MLFITDWWFYYRYNYNNIIRYSYSYQQVITIGIMVLSLNYYFVIFVINFKSNYVKKCLKDNIMT